MGAQNRPAPDVPRTERTSEEVLRDYRIGVQSREASIVGRREVMSGRAKFGIFGDGKEVPQLAMAHAFRRGDIRSGYYRDQTLMFALGAQRLTQFFAQLYAHADVCYEPATAGRSMNCHFATRFLLADGSWRNLTARFNSASDLSPTGAQMPKLVGLAYASRLYREVPELRVFGGFSENGNEIAWGTIGNASTAEGMFWESVNAIGVLRAPAVISVWDDGYGISVPSELQVVKGDIGELLRGFARAPGGHDGFDIHTVRGWDYPALLDVYAAAAETARRDHVPSIVHVVELTQPQGHSTSGSHERYKSAERLAWEQDHDCLRKMRDWIVAEGIASGDALDSIDAASRALVERSREAAWESFVEPIRSERDEAVGLIEALGHESSIAAELSGIAGKLASAAAPRRMDIAAAVAEALVATRHHRGPAKRAVVELRRRHDRENRDRYGSDLYSPTDESALRVTPVSPSYAPDAPDVFAFEIVNACFDALLARDPRVVAFGEDVGRLGDVNQGFRGLQDKYGALRVSDTGIRECTILGQAIGMALRGLRPIAEIQYLDYLLYALQLMSDDLATLRWRTKGGQKAPVIIRTRGHRLEGTWHSGSPMAGIIHLARGIYVCVPRNMTQAAGFYNTISRSDDAALVVEVLNAYRLRERLPDNVGDLTVPLGVPEILRPGRDITVVTYGPCCRIAVQAAESLARADIELEVIDVQTLLPFDRHAGIAASVQRTGRVVFMDEDVPGGTTAYMMQEVLERQGAYRWLDSPPRTLAAAAHRPAYGSDGDYYSKPNHDSLVELAFELMNEVDPARYPALAPPDAS